MQFGQWKSPEGEIRHGGDSWGRKHEVENVNKVSHTQNSVTNWGLFISCGRRGGKTTEKTFTWGNPMQRKDNGFSNRRCKPAEGKRACFGGEVDAAGRRRTRRGWKKKKCGRTLLSDRNNKTKIEERSVKEGRPPRAQQQVRRGTRPKKKVRGGMVEKGKRVYETPGWDYCAEGGTSREIGKGFAGRQGSTHDRRYLSLTNDRRVAQATGRGNMDPQK